MTHVIPDAKYYEIVENFRGTCDSSIQFTAEKLYDEMFPEGVPDNGVTIDHLNDELSERFMDDVQLCEVCGWWCEVSELEEHDDMDFVCEQCRGED